MTFMHI
jgi:hypothetical protein